MHKENNVKGDSNCHSQDSATNFLLKISHAYTCIECNDDNAIKTVIVTKISMDPCMEEHSFLWEGEGEKKLQFVPRRVPSNPIAC